MTDPPETLTWRGITLTLGEARGSPSILEYSFRNNPNEPWFSVVCQTVPSADGKTRLWYATVGKGHSPDLSSPEVALDYAFERHIERLQQREREVAQSRALTDILIQRGSG